MSPEEKKEAIMAEKLKVVKDSEALHTLINQRKEAAAKVIEKNKQIEQNIAKDVSEKREKESRKRMKRNADAEKELQEITSELMLELMQVCAQEEVPRYIMAIAKILDNYQGNFIIIMFNQFVLSLIIFFCCCHGVK